MEIHDLRYNTLRWFDPGRNFMYCQTDITHLLIIEFQTLSVRPIASSIKCAVRKGNNHPSRLQNYDPEPLQVSINNVYNFSFAAYFGIVREARAYCLEISLHQPQG